METALSCWQTEERNAAVCEHGAHRDHDGRLIRSPCAAGRQIGQSERRCEQDQAAEGDPFSSANDGA